MFYWTVAFGQSGQSRVIHVSSRVLRLIRAAEMIDDSTGKQIDFDFRGTTDDVIKRLLERFGDLPGEYVNQSAHTASRSP